MNIAYHVEAIERAALRAERAALEMSRQADRMEDVKHQLTILLGSGYGNNVELLLEQLTKQGVQAEAGEDTKRLDWLDGRVSQIVLHGFQQYITPCSGPLRAAIDAAIKREGGK